MRGHPALRTRLPTAPPPAPGSRPTLHGPDPLPGQAAALGVPIPGGSAGPKPRARPWVSPSTRGAVAMPPVGTGAVAQLGPCAHRGLCRAKGRWGILPQRGPQQPRGTPHGMKLGPVTPLKHPNHPGEATEGHPQPLVLSTTSARREHQQSPRPLAMGTRPRGLPSQPYSTPLKPCTPFCLPPPTPRRGSSTRRGK